MVNSILTFNISVSNKKKIASYKDPFQIMPATVNYIKDSDIESYKNIKNDKILIHLNYITRIFSTKGLEKDSQIRFSLRQYGKLADKIGTKNILIHMPKSLQEWNNFVLGYKIIHDELLTKDYIIHFEITSWAKDLQIYFGKDEDRESVIYKYYNVLFETAKSFNDMKNIKIVIDTAHMFANGCDEDTIIKIIEKYKDKMDYIHWNGNIKQMYTSDSHVPIFSKESKMSFEKISEYVSKIDKICICEITKDNATDEEWKEYCDKYGFILADAKMY